MAANRMIRDWTDSETIDQLSAEAERFFTRLIMKADDQGVYPANAKILRSKLFPLKEKLTSEDMVTWLGECLEAVNKEGVPLIMKYQASDGKEYLYINNYGQRLRNKRNTFPAPNSQQIAAVCGETRLEVETEVEEEQEVEKEEEQNSFIISVVAFMNEVFSSKYSPDKKATRQFIKARRKEGHTLEHFKAVILSRFKKWGADPAMSEYLRPETVFGNKFEGYLQASNMELKPALSVADQVKQNLKTKVHESITGENNKAD